MRSNAQIGYVVLNTQRIKIDESKSGISYNDAGKEGKYNDNDNGNEEREKSGDLNGSGSSVDKTLPKEQLFRLKLKHKTPNIQAQLSAKKAYVMIKITSQYRARQELIQQQEHLYPQQEFILQNSKQVQQHQRNRTFLPPQTLASNTSLTTQPQFITPVAPLLYASHRTYDGRATDTFPDSNDKRHDYVNNNNNNNNVRNATSTTTTNNDNDNDDNRDNNDNNNSINNSSIYNSSIDIDKNCCNVSRKGSSHIVVPAYTSHTYSQQETKPRHVHARAYFYPSHPQQLHQSDSPKPTHSLHLGHSNCSDISSQRKNSSSGDHSWNVDPSCPSCYSLHYRLMQSQAHVQRLEAILDTTLQSNSKYEKTDEKESSNINEIDLGGTETNGVEEKRKVNDDNDSDNEDGKRANVIVLSEVHRMKGLIDLKDHQLIKQQQIIQVRRTFICSTNYITYTFMKDGVVNSFSAILIYSLKYNIHAYNFYIGLVYP